VLPRPIDETPLDDAEEGEHAGYLMPEPQGDAEFTFTGAIDDYPEDCSRPGRAAHSGFATIGAVSRPGRSE